MSKVHLYAMREVERVLVEGKRRAVSVDRSKFAVPDKLSYLGSCTYWSKYRSVHDCSGILTMLFAVD